MKWIAFMLVMATAACDKAEPPAARPSQIRLDDSTKAKYYYFGERGVTETYDYADIPELSKVGVFVTIVGETYGPGEGNVWAIMHDEQGRYAHIERREAVAQRAYIAQRSVALATSVRDIARVMLEETEGSEALKAEEALRAEAQEKLGGASPFDKAGISPEELMRKRRTRWAKARIPEPRDFGLE